MPDMFYKIRLYIYLLSEFNDLSWKSAFNYFYRCHKYIFLVRHYYVEFIRSILLNL